MLLDRRYSGLGWRRFAGHDFVADRKTLAVTIGSAILGGLSHLGFDVFMHYDTPLFWPWRAQPIAAVPWAVDPVWGWEIELVAGAVFFAMAWSGSPAEGLARREEPAQDGVHLHHLLPPDRLVHLDHDAYG